MIRIKPLEQLDTSNLIVGETVKNYRELCKLLNQPVYGGGQKKNQLLEFSRFFEFDKQEEGNSILITEIYEDPLPPQFKIAPNSKYVEFIENILLDYLSKKPFDTVYLTSRALWEILGIVNKKYLQMQKRKKDLEVLHEKMTPFEINDFYKRCNQKFYKIVESSLESLKRRLYLKYSEINRIGTYIYEDSYVDGYIESFPSRIEYRDATDEDEKYILKVKREILNEYGYEFEKQVFLHNKTEDYYQKLNTIYKEEKGWDVVYQCYKIIYDKETVIKETNSREQRLGLNKVIIEAIDKQASDRVNKKGKDSNYVWEYAAKHDGEIPFYYHPSYEYLQKILSRELLKIKE